MVSGRSKLSGVATMDNTGWTPVEVVHAIMVAAAMVRQATGAKRLRMDRIVSVIFLRLLCRRR